MKSNIEALKNASIFSSVPDDHLESIAALIRNRRFDQGASIFRTGDPGTALYMIERGRVSIETTSEQGKQVALAELGPGDAFGDLAILDGSPRSASAMAAEETDCLMLARSSFLELIESNPGVTLSVLRSLAAIIRDMNDRLIEVGTHSYADRLGRELRRLAAEHGVDTPEGILIDRPLTHARLAASLGIWQGEIEALMARLAYEGIVMKVGDRFTITRMDLLAGA